MLSTSSVNAKAKMPSLRAIVRARSKAFVRWLSLFGWLSIAAKYRRRPGLLAAASPIRGASRIMSVMAVDISAITSVATEPGELPDKMTAWVIREEREGEPIDAFQLEEVDTPEPAAFEVVVRVMAAGVNFNNVWAALGKPISVLNQATTLSSATTSAALTLPASFGR